MQRFRDGGGEALMLADYIMLGFVGLVVVGGGVLLHGAVRRYRARGNCRRDEVQPAAKASRPLPAGGAAPGVARDAFADHEILDRTFCVASMLQALLLDRQDLPESIGEELEQASEHLWMAYQAMGRIALEAEPNRGGSK